MPLRNYLPYDPYGLQSNRTMGTYIARPYQEDALLKWVLPLKSNQKKITDYK
jgi:hypothetical protein